VYIPLVTIVDLGVPQQHDSTTRLLFYRLTVTLAIPQSVGEAREKEVKTEERFVIICESRFVDSPHSSHCFVSRTRGSNISKLRTLVPCRAFGCG
jgi:hypothetical protein